jgi:hypothetical protein
MYIYIYIYVTYIPAPEATPCQRRRQSRPAQPGPT